MAVKDGVSYYPTDNLISKKSRKHYRIPVRSQHWQLRSLISAEKQNFVYFPGGTGSNHVQRLNTTTKECETVKFLSFSPRCLVAENGWVCCGGETGEFTAIQLDGTTDDSHDLDLHLNLEPDARLPLGFESDSHRPEDTVFSLVAQSRRLNMSSRLNKSYTAKSQKLARDRVNCITMWFPPIAGPMHHGAYTEPAAVLANNDKTVVLVGLRDFESQDKVEPLDVVTYPDYVNRAIISPDGRLLIAILDDPFLYIHHRVETAMDDNGPFRADDKPEFRWELCGKILLKSQRRDDGSDSRGSFAACFSNSGAYLAVGTQYGTISIFDVAGLTDPDVTDPLLTSFTSSRPRAGPGAVRDMAFCPGPYDLLAWTEDRGHVGIADLRTGFVQRQILDIGADGDYEHIPVLDRATIDPRLLEGRGERNDVPLSAFPGSFGLGEGRRRRGSEGPERHHLALTPDETRVLEALQDERRRREQRERIAARMAEQSASLSPLQQLPLTPWGWRLPRPIDYDSNPGVATTRARSSSVSRSLGEQSDAARTTGDRGDFQPGNVSRAIGDLLGNIRDSRERAQERIRNAHRLILQSNADRDRMLGMMNAHPPRRAASIRPGDASTATQRAASDLRSLTPSASGWADLEALYSLSFESNVQDLRAATRDRDRDRSSILPLLNSVAIRELEERNARRRVALEHGVHEADTEPDNTAGISWSEDGRILYVGAENGIYEFQVDVQGRKFHPNLNLR
ncbi:WD domain-containing protein [Colletotrichum truncatum]|uniref:WD domain-containing protein n=1 Tax=Colletotrichum truncatum TaxID=5467 RepID=A0ACC3YMG8_COLTU|nr:WD domain-containing protein [Colletotrichum truncatum]KAF6792250.1 WD domain-containing protein [Colletotrichum truncatum]